MRKSGFIDMNTEDNVSQLAQDETGKRQYYRPVYSLHKWWARRPGALFRSIILLATKSNKELFLTTANGSISKLSEYFKDHTLENSVILDPFMGGGTTLVEANRLGAKVVGCDLNPVAYWVVRESLKPLEPKKLQEHFSALERSVGEEIKEMYRTRSTVPPEANCDILYTFWVRC